MSGFRAKVKSMPLPRKTCPACNGKGGSISIPKSADAFPVANICGACKGKGTVTPLQFGRLRR